MWALVINFTNKSMVQDNGARAIAISDSQSHCQALRLQFPGMCVTGGRSFASFARIDEPRVRFALHRRNAIRTMPKITSL